MYIIILFYLGSLYIGASSVTSLDVSFWFYNNKIYFSKVQGVNLEDNFFFYSRVVYFNLIFIQMSGLLYALLIIPMIGIFFILSFDSYNFNITSNNSNSRSFSAAGNNSEGELLKVHVINNELNFYKKIALITTIMNLIVSLIIYILFDFSTNQFQFVQDDLELSVYNIYLGVDGLSIYFVLLTTIIMPIALISNWNSITHNIKAYLIIILLLETLLLAVFLVLDVLLFYIFFESILPPLFILIGLFGSSNKVRASFYIFLYTLLGSLFLLLSILTMSSLIGTTYLDVLSKSNFEYTTQIFLFLGVFIAFAVKTPVWGLNSWLLKAHVESPLGGSLILASIVLKLSLYGIYRIILPLLPKVTVNYTYIIFAIAIVSVLYASLGTLRTTDVKELIAYSSVAHAALYLAGAFSNTIQGIEGSYLLGLGHGFVSSGLFICAGGILYDRSGTRIISFYRGTAQLMPLFSLLFFILCLGNAGTPLTLNFVGEFMSLYGTFENHPLLGAIASSSIVFSAAYTIFMYNRIAFGGSFSLYFKDNIGDVTKREFFMLLTLVIFTIMLGIYPSFILDGLHYCTTGLIYRIDGSGSLLHECSNYVSSGIVPNGVRSFSTKCRNPRGTRSFNTSKSKSNTIDSSMVQAREEKSLNNNKSDAEWVTGFTDAEGNFSVNIVKSPKSTLGYRINLSFTIGLHNKDLNLLRLLQQFFQGIGGITKLGLESSQFRVTSLSDLLIIIKHFENYPLLTQKRIDFLLFKEVYYLVCNKQHLTKEGLLKIVSIRASINTGLSEDLKKVFNVVPVPRLTFPFVKIPSYSWLSGFVCGDGSFVVSISKSDSTKSGFIIRLFFSICQDKRDSELMKNLVEYLSCGSWIEKSSKSYGEIVVSKFSDIWTKIIPIFEKYPMHGDKQLDFLSFKKAAEIIYAKNHLTVEGENEIRDIKNNMNTKRYLKD